MRFFKLNRTYYKDLGSGKNERISAYRFQYGVTICKRMPLDFDDPEIIPINEQQYNRVRKIVIKKLQTA